MSEVTFKILLAIVFFPFMIIWTGKFFRSGMKKDSFYTKNEGILAALVFRILLTASVLAILLYFFDSGLINRANLKLPAWIRFTGFPAGIIINILIYYSLWNMGSNFSASLKIKKGHQLITTGIFSYVRHPLYVLFCAMWTCFFLLTTNYFIGATGIITYLIIFIYRVPIEEKMMREKFGKKYDDYSKMTPRYFPRIRVKRKR